MLISYVNGQTSIILRVKLRQDTTGAKPGNGITGLTNSSTGLIIGTIADTEASSTAYTSAGSTIQTIATLGTYAAPSASDCRFKEVDSTNHPGVYEIQLANARYAVSSAKSLIVSITGVSGLSDCDVTVPLPAVNPYDGVRAGLTALPSAAVGSGANSFNFDGSGYIKNDTQAVAGNTAAATNMAAGWAGILYGSAQGGGASTITLPSAAVAQNNFYNNQSIDILAGTGAGQTNKIQSYVGATQVATVETPWVTQPDVTSIVMVLGRIG